MKIEKKENRNRNKKKKKKPLVPVGIINQD